MAIGNIHSIETFGTVDGPGIRMVIFMQGCPMRCLYCHNPDTWSLESNQQITSDEIIRRYESIREFCKGGITVTGGEPLLQMTFVTDLFKKAQAKQIHTCLDTSGITFNPKHTEPFDRLLHYTSLVLLDIKHIDDSKHQKLTGRSNHNILSFARYLSDHKIPVWIRHVVVPTITDDEQYLQKLGRFLKTINNIEALDVLPYHDMGMVKYQKLGIPYPLINIPSLTKEQAIRAREIILRAMQNA